VIFFGQRAYGVAAAAEAFFGKSLDKLDVAEAATIAGVPKAPSRYNPIVDPQLATGAAPTCCGACVSSGTSMPPRRSRQQGADAGARPCAAL